LHDCFQSSHSVLSQFWCTLWLSFLRWRSSSLKIQRELVFSFFKYLNNYFI
jgi:hypothetical protein